MRLTGTTGRVTTILVGCGVLLSAVGAAAAGAAPLKTAVLPLLSAASTKPSAGITLVDSTTSLTLGPGTSSSVSISVQPVGTTGSITLSVTSAIPTGVTAVLSPTTLKSAGTSTLTVGVGAAASPGTTSIKVTATSGKTSSSTLITLTAVNNLARFKMSLAAPISGLVPGASVPVDIAFTNPNSLPLQLSALSMSITAVTQPPGTTLPCGTSDYTISQFSGVLPLTLPAAATTRLSSLVPNSAQWPALSMLNLPTSQDGCRGATVSFAFAGSAHT